MGANKCECSLSEVLKEWREERKELLKEVRMEREASRKLMEEMIGMQREMITLMKGKQWNQVVQGQSSREAPPISLPALTSTIVTAMRSSQKDSFQSNTAMLVGIPEMDTEQETMTNDTEIVDKLRENIGNDLDLSGMVWSRPRIDKRKTRMIELKFSSEELRDSFVMLASKKKTAVSITDSHHVFIRREYSKMEIKLDRDLRRQAGIQNSDCGQMKYIVRDLSIVTLPHPRPLPQRSQINLEKRLSKEKSRQDSGTSFPVQQKPSRGRAASRGRGMSRVRGDGSSRGGRGASRGGASDRGSRSNGRSSTVPLSNKGKNGSVSTRSQSKRRLGEEENAVDVEGKSDAKRDKQALSPIASVPSSQYSSPSNIEEMPLH